MHVQLRLGLPKWALDRALVRRQGSSSSVFDYQA